MPAAEYDLELDAIARLVEWERTQLVLRGQVDVSAILDTLDRTIRICRELDAQVADLELDNDDLREEIIDLEADIDALNSEA